MPVPKTLSLVLACLFTSLMLGPSPARAEDDLLAGAKDRIERNRKADLTITVVHQGEPVSGAMVRVEQTRHAFLFGSNIFRWGRQPSPEAVEAYKNQFKDVFNFATLPFYWWSYDRAIGEPSHDSRMEVAEWCVENGIRPKGHPLAWNHNDARWYPEDPEALYELQLERTDDCVSHFKGVIDTWDVVNEATHYDRDSFMKAAPKFTGMWKHYGQIDFTKACFAEAREANPEATLLINDYRTDPAYATLIEKLVDEDGKPIYDVIGIQSHMHGGEWSNEKIWEVCERFARFDVPLHFTEMTILSGERKWGGRQNLPDWASTPEGEERQAREVERVYTMLFSHPSVEAITWWDFADDGAWQGAPAGFLRKDQSPKPAYETLHRLIKEDWWTDETVKSDASGRAELRAFLGEHRLTVTLPDGTKSTLPITVEKGTNDFKIELE